MGKLRFGIVAIVVGCTGSTPEDGDKEGYDDDIIFAGGISDEDLLYLQYNGIEAQTFDELVVLAQANEGTAETFDEGFCVDGVDAYGYSCTGVHPNPSSEPCIDEYGYEVPCYESPSEPCIDEYGYEIPCVEGARAPLVQAAIPFLVVGAAALAVGGGVIVVVAGNSQQSWNRRNDVHQIGVEGRTGAITVEVPQAVVELFREPHQAFRSISVPGSLLALALESSGLIQPSYRVPITPEARQNSIETSRHSRRRSATIRETVVGGTSCVVLIARPDESRIIHVGSARQCERADLSTRSSRVPLANSRRAYGCSEAPSTACANRPRNAHSAVGTFNARSCERPP